MKGHFIHSLVIHLGDQFPESIQTAIWIAPLGEKKNLILGVSEDKDFGPKISHLLATSSILLKFTERKSRPETLLFSFFEPNFKIIVFSTFLFFH